MKNSGMSDWQRQFSQKLNAVRSATRDQFEQIAEQALGPVFAQIEEFTGKQDIRASSPLSKPGIRTYKFALTDKTYVLVTFRHTGLQCGTQADFFVPGAGQIAPICETTDLPECDENWCGRTFQQALDRFVDAVTKLMDSVGSAELAGAAV